MAKRMRRFTMTVGGSSVSGARDFEFDDESEWNNDRADDEGAGDEVRISTGPFSVRFELLARDTNVETGYAATMVVVAKEIEVSSGVESSTDKTYTFSDGWLKVGGNFPTDNAGRIPVTGRFKTCVES